MVELNADFTQRALVHAARLAWTPSPSAGVERRMLDRIGDEVARATSIVRYAPDSRFPAHTHGGGEEFFVLEGIFQDEQGDYPAGCYVRNPPTSSHTPASASGCTIFVKLWQFDPDDRTHVRIDTGKTAFRPVSGRPGVELMPLFQDPRESVRLERWAQASRSNWPCRVGSNSWSWTAEFSEGGESFGPQSWLRLPPGARLGAQAGAMGCRLWAKSGHLLHPQAPPGAASRT